MMQEDVIVNRPEMDELVQKYIRHEISMAEIANELEVTKSAVSFVFNKKIIPSPVKLKKQHYVQACKQTKQDIEQGKTVEEIVRRYPFLKNKKRINRLIKKGDIKTGEKVLTSSEKGNLELRRKVIDKFKLDLSVNEIAESCGVKRGKVLSIFRSEFGTKNITEARKIVHEKKR